MAKCKNCKNIEWHSDISADGERKYNWCPIIDDCPDPEAERNCGYYDEMTNADRIRSMSDAEMARFISRAQADRAKPIVCGQITKFPFGECEWLEWLQSLVEV